MSELDFSKILDALRDPDPEPPCMFDLRWHLAALWAHVGELLTMVCEECAAWAAGGE